MPGRTYFLTWEPTLLHPSSPHSLKRAEQAVRGVTCFPAIPEALGSNKNQHKPGEGCACSYSTEVKAKVSEIQLGSGVARL